MTLLHSQTCRVLTDRGGEIGWLGQNYDIAAGRAAMDARGPWRWR